MDAVTLEMWCLYLFLTSVSVSDTAVHYTDTSNSYVKFCLYQYQKMTDNVKFPNMTFKRDQSRRKASGA